MPACAGRLHGVARDGGLTALLIVRGIRVIRERASIAALPFAARPEPVAGCGVRPEREYASCAAGAHLLLVVAGVVGATRLCSSASAVLVHQVVCDVLCLSVEGHEALYAGITEQLCNRRRQVQSIW